MHTGAARKEQPLLGLWQINSTFTEVDNHYVQATSGEILPWFHACCWSRGSVI